MFESIRNVSTNIYVISEHITSLKHMTDALRENGILAWNRILTKVGEQTQKESLSGYFSLLSRVASGDLSFRRSSQGCWMEMTKLRSKSLCFICSGRSNIFIKKSKAILKQETCSRILNSCTSEFQLLLKVVNGSKRFLQLLRKSLEKGGLFYSVFTRRVEHVLAKLSAVGSSDLLRRIWKIRRSKDPRFVVRAKLCSGVTSLVKRPFLQYLMPIFEELAEDLGFLHEISRRMLFRKADSTTNETLSNTLRQILFQDLSLNNSEYQDHFKVHRSKVWENFHQELNETAQELQAEQHNQSAQKSGDSPSTGSSTDSSLKSDEKLQQRTLAMVSDEFFSGELAECGVIQNQKDGNKYPKNQNKEKTKGIFTTDVVICLNATKNEISQDSSTSAAHQYGGSIHKEMPLENIEYDGEA